MLCRDVVLVFVMGISALCFAQAGTMYEGFESGKPNWDRVGWPFNQENGNLYHAYACCDHAFTVVGSPVRDGKHAVKCTLNYSDPAVAGNHRAEIQAAYAYLRNERWHKLGTTWWYSFSIYLPDDFVVDTRDELVMQIMSTPCEGHAFQSPVFGVYLYADKWAIRVRHNSTLCSDDKIAKNLWTGTWEKGKWTDWVIKIAWSWESDGLVEVWKDDAKIVAHEGPNSYRNVSSDPKMGMFMKFGVYKFSWKSQGTGDCKQRVVYYDQIRTAPGSWTYDQVKPSGNRNDTTSDGGVETSVGNEHASGPSEPDVTDAAEVVATDTAGSGALPDSGQVNRVADLGCVIADSNTNSRGAFSLATILLLTIAGRALYRWSAVVIVICLGWCGVASAWESKLVSKQGDGFRFENVDGFVLQDYSYAGYKAGEVPIPDVSVKKVIEPVSGDNTAHIQDALDRIAGKGALPPPVAPVSR